MERHQTPNFVQISFREFLGSSGSRVLARMYLKSVFHNAASLCISPQHRITAKASSLLISITCSSSIPQLHPLCRPTRRLCPRLRWCHSRFCSRSRHRWAERSTEAMAIDIFIPTLRPLPQNPPRPHPRQTTPRQGIRVHGNGSTHGRAGHRHRGL